MAFVLRPAHVRHVQERIFEAVDAVVETRRLDVQPQRNDNPALAHTLVVGEIPVLVVAGETVVGGCDASLASSLVIALQAFTS